MKPTLDFLKIDGGKLGAINFNNMLPVTDNNIIKLDLNKTCFTTSEQKYINMLKKQVYWLNRNSVKIYKRSEKIYNGYISKTLDIRISKRCCDFKLLEEKCKEYNR